MDIWYCNKRIGQNMLSGFLSHISHVADLSKVYTNHSIGVTATTFLKRVCFSDNQIMAVTGYKSVFSLSLYKHVSIDEKITMGIAMNLMLAAEKNTPPALPEPEPTTPVTPPQPLTSMEIVPADTAPKNPLDQIPEEEDTDMLKWLTENIEKQVSSTTNPTAMSTTTISNQVAQKPLASSFVNCKIGQINFHIHKH